MFFVFLKYFICFNISCIYIFVYIIGVYLVVVIRGLGIKDFIGMDLVIF